MFAARLMGWLDKGYPLLLGALWVASLVPIWLADWLPLQHWGFAVEQLDVMWRHADPASGYVGLFEWPAATAPGTLHLWAAAVLGPAVGTMVTAKLLLSFAIGGFPLAVLSLAKAFDRSRWLAIATLPLAWGAAVADGSLGAAIAIPLVFWMLALTRRLCLAPRPRHVVGLLLLLPALYYAHFLLFLTGWALSLLLLVTHVPPRRLLVAAPIWVVPLPLAVPHLVQTWIPAHTVTLENPTDRIRQFANASVDLFSGNWEELVVVLLSLAWLALMLRGRDPETPPPPPAGAGRLPTSRYFGLELLTGATILLYLLAPTAIDDAPLGAPRLAVIALVLGLLWPRETYARGWGRLLQVGYIAAAVALTVTVNVRMVAFSIRTADPLQQLLADLPDGATIGLAQRRLAAWPTGPIALHSLGSGIHAVRNAAPSSKTAAWASRAPRQRGLRFAPGRFAPELEVGWLRGDAVFDFDHILVDTTKDKKVLEKRQGATLRKSYGPWLVYDVVDPEGALSSATIATGRHAATAEPTRWACPRDNRLVGLMIDVDLLGIARLQPLCRRWDVAALASGAPEPKPTQGPSLGVTGTRSRRVEQLCPRGQAIVALNLHSEPSLGLTGLQLLCQAFDTAGAAGAAGDRATRQLIGAPGDGTHQATLACPDRTAGRGIGVRAGPRLEALTLRCDPPERR